MVGSCLICLMLLLAAAPPPATPVATAAPPTTAPRKDAVPDAASQKQATAVIEEVYKADLSRTARQADRVALSKKLLQAAVETTNDPPGRWVLATSARDLALDSGWVDGTFTAIDFIDKSYQVDGAKLRTDALEKLSHQIRSTDDAKALYKRCNALLDGELAADHYDRAYKYSEMALSAARRTNDPSLVNSAGIRLRETHTALIAFAEVKEAQAKLATQPNDPAANTAVGRFRCFVKSDWQNGLPLLAHGLEGALKTLATNELFADPADAIKVADGWWGLADKEADVSRQLRWHAAEIYKTALPQLTGLTKAKVQERLSEAGPVPVSTLAPKPPAPPPPPPPRDD